MLSIGVGEYPEPKRWINPKHFVTLLEKIFLGFTSLELLQKTLDVNTTSMEQLRSVLFKDIQTVRINEAFTQPEMATHLLESNLEKLTQELVDDIAKGLSRSFRKLAEARVSY